jgi:hypothetical protein
LEGAVLKSQRQAASISTEPSTVGVVEKYILTRNRPYPAIILVKS